MNDIQITSRDLHRVRDVPSESKVARDSRISDEAIRYVNKSLYNELQVTRDRLGSLCAVLIRLEERGRRTGEAID